MVSSATFSLEAMMIEVNKAQWHARLFIWSVDLWGNFKNNPNEIDRFRHGTNICHYIRTIFVAVPVVFLSMGLFAWWAVYVLILSPVGVLGWQVYLMGLAALIVISGLSVFSHWLYQGFTWKPKLRRKRMISAFDLGVEFIVAQKRRICPLVVIEEASHEA